MKTLSIQSSRAALDIHTTRAQLDIRNHVRRGFKVKTTRPQMHVERQMPQMKVDWKQVWANRGLRSPKYFMQHTRQLARQIVNEAIQNMVAGGDYMAQLEGYFNTAQNPIGDWAYEQMLVSEPEVVMSSGMPAPDVQWTEGSVKIEWEPGEIEIVWEDEFMPEITVTPYSVEIRLKNRAEVQISVNENSIPKTRGKKIDQKV